MEYFEQTHHHNSNPLITGISSREQLHVFRIAVIRSLEHIPVLHHSPLQFCEVRIAGSHHLQRAEIQPVRAQLRDNIPQPLRQAGFQARQVHQRDIIPLQRVDSKNVPHDLRGHLIAHQQPQRDSLVQQVDPRRGQRRQRESQNARQNQIARAEELALRRLRRLRVLEEGSCLASERREEGNLGVHVGDVEQKRVEEAHHDVQTALPQLMHQIRARVAALLAASAQHAALLQRHLRLTKLARHPRGREGAARSARGSARSARRAPAPWSASGSPGTAGGLSAARSPDPPPESPRSLRVRERKRKREQRWRTRSAMTSCRSRSNMWLSTLLTGSTAVCTRIRRSPRALV